MNPRLLNSANGCQTLQSEHPVSSPINAKTRGALFTVVHYVYKCRTKQ